VKARVIFLQEFAKHQASFPGCDAEALFIGTVVHSLDHYTMEMLLQDPLWHDVDCPKYGLMAKLSRIARVGFVEEIPGVYFQSSFRDSSHPFYQSAYLKTAKWDTCIIR
jgi:hypothetical protein